MNKKLIAAAVSAAVVAPVASHADAVLYGRINNAIDMNDISDKEDADSTTDITNIVSRIGVRANAELDNGLSVHGHYEFLTVSDREEDDDGSGIDDTRIATVGLSGGFGRIDVGQQWSAYFNTVGTLISPTYTLGFYLYSSVGKAPFRASNTIKYSNTFGPVTAQLDVRLNDSDEGGDVAEKLAGDGIGLGLSFAVTDNITIAAAFDSEDGVDDEDELGITATVMAPDTVVGTHDTVTGDVTVDYTADDGRTVDADRVGIAAKANFGGFWAALGWQSYEASDLDAVTFGVDDNEDGDRADAGDIEVTAAAVEEVEIDTMFLWGGGSFSDQTSWMVGYSEADDGDDDTDTDDSSQVTVGIYHNLGGGMRLYYEGASLDSENEEWDGARHLLGMRIDF